MATGNLTSRAGFNADAAAAASTTPSWTIFCIFVGEDVAFPIEIQPDVTVGELKDQIKAKTKPDADELILYLVNIPDDDNLVENAKKRLESIPALDATQKVSALFPNTPAEGTINILVLGKRSDIETVRRKIDMFVDRLRPQIRDSFNTSRLAHWKPPETVDDETKTFYNVVKIPAVYGWPSLLLHNLHDNPNPNPNAKTLFTGKPNRYYIMLLELEKTRLLFEGLCQHWGFYFVADRGPDRIGSEDLKTMIETMSHDRDWRGDILKQSSEHRRHSRIANKNIATRAILKVLLARWIVFLTFLEVAKDHNGGALTNYMKFDWLLFQALPFVHIDRDPFLDLIHTCLADVDVKELNSLMASFNPEEALRSDFSWYQFFYVLDQAQFAGKKYMGCFNDAEGKPRPVLEPIIRVLRSDIDIQIVLSGTAFSLDHFRTVSARGVAKDVPWSEEYGTGDFMVEDVQLAYVTSLLPPTFLASESGKALVRRMNMWLRGRYRFTAGMIEELLRGPWNNNSPAAPHKLLNAYVKRHSGFSPFDGDSALLTQEPDVDTPLDTSEGA